MPDYVIKRVPDELYHFGIKGQKWGVRRFQNADGTLTEEGKKRYGSTYDEVKKNADAARETATRLRRRSDDLNSRLFFTNDIANHVAARRATKAEKKSAEYDRILNGMKEHIEAKRQEAERQKVEDKKGFDIVRQAIRRKGISKWMKDSIAKGDRTVEDHFFNHIYNSQSELLNKWWDEREEVRGDDNAWRALQMKYAKQLASNLGLPKTSDTYDYCAGWFFTGDD